MRVLKRALSGKKGGGGGKGRATKKSTMRKKLTMRRKPRTTHPQRKKNKVSSRKTSRRSSKISMRAMMVEGNTMELPFREDSSYLNYPVDGGNTKEFVFEDGFVEKVRYDIMNPEVHREINKPAEVCGSFFVTLDSETGRYVIHHDSKSTTKKESNERGFHRGTYDPEDNVQFCHPRKYSANILWHAHPKGVPSYPSGSDVFVTMINDCTENLHHLDTAAQAFVEFLFTEHGFWVIHRGVTKDGQLASAIDLTDAGGKPIRLNYHSMVDVEEVRSHVDTLMTLLERKIMSNYFRTQCPDQQAVNMINHEINTNPVFHLIRDRTRLQFFNWSELENGKQWSLRLPGVLIDTAVTNVCLRR